MERVKIICGVSGGSILAAHLLVYWNDYLGRVDAAFRSRVRHLVNSIRTRDISGNVLRKSKDRILSLRPLDSEFLVSEYRELLDSDTCTISRWDDVDVTQEFPQLHILATHLNTGRAGAYSVTGFRIPHVADGQRHAKEINAFSDFAGVKRIRDQYIARAVAASSAFPPAFSPIRLIPDDPTHLLTDGGVYDNGGVNYLRDLYETGGVTATKDRMVIVSDAGREFPTELGHQYDSFLALTVRVTDTQGDRIADADSNAAKTFFEARGIPVLKLSIHDVIEPFPGWPSNHSEKVQELLGMMRTELDKFSAEEVFVLYRHGYLVAQQAFAVFSQGTLGSQFTRTDVPWTPVDPVVSTGTAARPDADGLTNADLRAIEKDDLEHRLKDSHLNKKPAVLAALVRRWFLGWFIRRHPFLASSVAVIALLLFSSIAAIGYLLGEWIAPRIIPPVAALGALAITDVEPYDPDSWAARIPTLTPVLSSSESKFVYAITTSSIGSLTRDQPHTAAVAHVELLGPLKGAELYLFLEQQTSPGEVKRVVLEEVSPRKLKVAAGGASDRLRGVIVSHTEIQMLQTTVPQKLSIRLETP